MEIFHGGREKLVVDIIYIHIKVMRGEKLLSHAISIDRNRARISRETRHAGIRRRYSRASPILSRRCLASPARMRSNLPAQYKQYGESYSHTTATRPTARGTSWNVRDR